ncbi:hypothetical protein B0T21DRAFT_87378 [Apiosordaria backusii]|uniref:Uncharacterized protein n=1 Tax=Apiosordaria backusii TaxID=314023 RepID=A0AA40ERV5_9PEZI|nr:hypothetical protein B0T21DRAFT_87378 [Apiosordaria backusii]
MSAGFLNRLWRHRTTAGAALVLLFGGATYRLRISSTILNRSTQLKIGDTSIAEIQHALEDGSITSKELVQVCYAYVPHLPASVLTTFTYRPTPSIPISILISTSTR